MASCFMLLVFDTLSMYIFPAIPELLGFRPYRTINDIPRNLGRRHAFGQYQFGHLYPLWSLRNLPLYIPCNYSIRYSPSRPLSQSAKSSTL